jgi:hypothetical protein
VGFSYFSRTIKFLVFGNFLAALNSGNTSGRSFEDTIDEIDGHLIASAPNAYFNPRTNEYHIALDSIGQAYMYFAVHESIHDIAANTRLGYERLEEIVLDTLRAQGEDIAALVDVQKKIHPGQDEAYWREEVVANTVPAILTDRQAGKEFALRFANEDEATRNVFEKILDAIRAFLQKAYDVLRQEKSWRQMESIKSIWTRLRQSARRILTRWRKRLVLRPAEERRGSA